MIAEFPSPKPTSVASPVLSLEILIVSLLTASGANGVTCSYALELNPI